MDERTRERVFDRDGYRCTGCGARGGDRGDAELHADHIVPKAAGGRDTTGNLTTRCASCHAQRHSNPRIDRGGSGSWSGLERGRPSYPSRGASSRGRRSR